MTVFQQAGAPRVHAVGRKTGLLVKSPPVRNDELNGIAGAFRVWRWCQAHSIRRYGWTSGALAEHSMARDLSLNFRLAAMMGVFAVLICGIVGVTWWVTEAQKADAITINLAGRQRMLTQKLTKATLGYVIELRETDEARKEVDLIVETRGHMARAIAAAKAADQFTLTENTLDFAPAAAARDIAARFSADKDLTLRQVSTKYRNPDNKPDEYEAKILAMMAENPEQWKDRDWTEKVVDGDHATIRYMRPLFVTEACMTCHGDPEDVPALVKEKYPDDLATGYKVGDLRGAVSVLWPTQIGRAHV